MKKSDCTIFEEVDRCNECRFCKIADSLDPICVFEPNFERAPKRRLLKLSNVEPDTKRKDDKVTAIFIPEDRVYFADKKPTWCRLKHMQIAYAA